MKLKLARARIHATDRMPYYSSALWALVFVEHKDLAKKLPTIGMGVDQQWRLHYDPVALKKFGKGQLSALLIHEVSHVVRDHASRMGTRDAGMWNIAGDLEINDDLQQDFTLPDGCVYPQTYGFDEGLTAEAYYALLQDKQPKDKPKCHCGSGAQGGKDEPKEGESNEIPGLSEAEATIIRAEVADKVNKYQGNLPAGMKRWASQFLDPKVNWKTHLRRLVRNRLRQKAGCTDYSYSKPPRRRWGNVILPSMISYDMFAGIVIDTSGSMDETLLCRAVSEAKGICKGASTEANIYLVDAAVGKKVKGNKLTLELTGGGGTDMRVGITEALKDKPDIIIVLTDGYTPWPQEPVGVPVIAGIIGHSSPPPAWIETIRIEE